MATSSIEQIPHELENPRQLCWMNATCQLLATIPEIINYAREFKKSTNGHLFTYAKNICEYMCVKQPNLEHVMYNAFYNDIIKNNNLEHITQYEIKQGGETIRFICEIIDDIKKRHNYIPGYFPFAFMAFIEYFDNNLNAGFYLYCSLLFNRKMNTGCGALPYFDDYDNPIRGIDNVIIALNIEYSNWAKILPSTNKLEQFDDILRITEISVFVCSEHTNNIRNLEQFNLAADDVSHSFMYPLRLPTYGCDMSLFQAMAHIQVFANVEDHSHHNKCSYKDLSIKHDNDVLKFTVSSYSQYAMFTTEDWQCQKSGGNLSRHDTSHGVCIPEHVYLMHSLKKGYFRYDLIAQIYQYSGHYISVIKDSNGDWYKLGDKIDKRSKQNVEPHFDDYIDRAVGSTTNQAFILLYKLNSTPNNMSLQMIHSVIQEQITYNSGPCKVIKKAVPEHFADHPIPLTLKDLEILRKFQSNPERLIVNEATQATSSKAKG